MVFFKSVKSPGLATGAVFGGFCLLGAVLLAIAAAIVLSLISVYVPNQSQQAFGDAYQINSLGLKSVYTNISSVFTRNNSIAVNKALSDACTKYLTNLGLTSLAGCLINRHNVIVSAIPTSVLSRRKRDVNAAIISTATAVVYYTTTCGKPADKGKYGNDPTLSLCVKIRLAACNLLYNSSYGAVSNVTNWSVTSPISYTILSDDSLSYIFVTVSGVFGIQPSALIASYGSYLSATTISQLNAGCQYLGPISVSDIAAILNSQNTFSLTTTSYSG